MPQKAITFVFSLKTSFVLRDVSMLKGLGYKVFLIESKPFSNLLLFFWNRILEFFLSLVYISRSSAVICWFSDYHSFLPLLTAKFWLRKSIVIVGGYDAVSSKELNYGIFLKNNFRQKIARWNYRLADQIFVVHKSLAEGCTNAYKQNEIKSGIKKFMPKLKTPIVEVPTGYDVEFWSCEAEKIPKTILTVANISDERTFKRKGISLFLTLAKALPDYRFTIAGMTAKWAFQMEKPPNVVVLGKQNAQELRKLYNESKYYFQGSQIEGLPNVLCEAMLCECLPIGNAVFGMPEAIGKTGVVFDGISELSKVARFLKSPEEKSGAEARRRIKTLYSKGKRAEIFQKFLIHNKSK